MHFNNVTIAVIVFLFSFFISISCTKTSKEGREEVIVQIIVKFNKQVQTATIDSISSELGLAEAKRIPQLNIAVYKCSEHHSKKIIKKCEQIPSVEYAEIDHTFQTFK